GAERQRPAGWSSCGVLESVSHCSGGHREQRAESVRGRMTDTNIALSQQARMGERYGDVLTFLGAFTLGAGLYFVLRLAGSPQLLLTVVVVGVMVAYALAAAILPRLRVKLDQAGDNAYYLGLL